jgi:type II secretory pathway component PulF
MLPYQIKELALVYEKLARVYHSGISLVDSFPTVMLGVSHRQVRIALELTYRQLLQGGTLTAGFARSPQVFPEFDLALIEVGEAQGQLEQCFHALAKHHQHRYQDLKRFLYALIYPAFLLLAAIFLPPFPEFINHGPEAYFASVGSTLAYLLIPIVLIYGSYRLFRTQAPVVFSQVLLALPVFGKHIRQLAIARFCRSMAILYAAGVELRRAIKLSVTTMANPHMQQRCWVLAVALDEGRLVSEGLEVAKVFPPEFVHNFALGEQTGELDKVLNQVADFYEFEADRLLQACLKMLPVVIYLFVAGYIGYIVVSFYAKAFQAIGDIK